jgi:hypothetical protein
MIKRFLFIYRAEIALGFCLSALAAMTFLWAVIFSAPLAEKPIEARRAPARNLKTERLESVKSTVKSRVNELEKVSGWRYADPFAARQGTNTSAE